MYSTVAATAALLLASSSLVSQVSGAKSTGGLSVVAPSTNPTTCDPATIQYTYTGNASWSVTIALSNAGISQSPLKPKPVLFQNIQLGLPSTGNTPMNVNWSQVDVPEGYYVILAQAAPPDGYYTNVSYQPAEAATDRFQIVNGTSTACLYPDQDTGSGKSTNVGAIVGGVIGGLALLALLAVAACCLAKRRRSRKERLAGAIPIEEQKPYAAKSEKGFVAPAAAVAAEDPFTKKSTTHREALSTAYDEDSTRAGSMHTMDDPEHSTVLSHHNGLADPFSDNNTGEYLPSQRSSTLDPDSHHTFGDLGTGANGATKTGRKPAPDYEGGQEHPEAIHEDVTPSASQTHILYPDPPKAF